MHPARKGIPRLYQGLLRQLTLKEQCVPKFGCVCGHVMNLSQDWRDYELSLVPEVLIADISDELRSSSTLSADVFDERIAAHARQVYLCPACGRLHLETAGAFKSYVAEGNRHPER